LSLGPPLLFAFRGGPPPLVFPARFPPLFYKGFDGVLGLRWPFLPTTSCPPSHWGVIIFCGPGSALRWFFWVFVSQSGVFNIVWTFFAYFLLPVSVYPPPPRGAFPTPSQKKCLSVPKGSPWCFLFVFLFFHPSFFCFVFEAPLFIVYIWWDPHVFFFTPPFGGSPPLLPV